MKIKVSRSVLWRIVFAALTNGVLGLALAFPHSDAYTNGVAPYIRQSVTYAQEGNWDGMIKACDEAIRLNPNAIDAYRGRGAAYYQKGEWSQVLSNYAEVIRLEPADADAYSYRGYAYGQIGSFDKDIEEYTKSLNLSSNAPSADAYGAYLGRGFAYGATHEPDKAISDLDEAIRLNPKAAQAFFYRGHAYRAKSKFSEAASDFAKAIQLDPHTSEFLRTFAWLLATCPDATVRDGSKAVELAKQARDTAPMGDWECLETLAAAYAEAGDFESAVKYQKMSIGATGSGAALHLPTMESRLDLYLQHKPCRDVPKP